MESSRFGICEVRLVEIIGIPYTGMSVLANEFVWHE